MSRTPGSRTRPSLPARLGLLTLALLTATLPWSAAAQDVGGEAPAAIPSPEEYFGFQMGTDGKLAHWDDLVAYYRLIDEASDRVTFVEMGPSTLGNPFLVAYVSAPETLARLDEYKAMNAVLSDPRGHSEADVKNAIDNGKVVFVQSYALHSTEVAASQSAAEIMYEFATRDDDEILEILDNTISILIPSLNPDGTGMVADWVAETNGTPYQGARLPWLYHYYIGHDNNRDAFMQNTVESQYGAEIMFREWVPQAFIDHHQMGGYTARISLPPYAEPVRPEADPLVWREMSWYGAHMAYKMDEKALPGAIGAAIYSGWGHFGFHWITPFHNIAGMLTESASARMADPLYVHPDQLNGSRQFPEYAEQTTYPNPWGGGWWHVRDIVVRQKVATFSPLEIAAKNRETVLRSAYLKASRQTQRGLEGEVKAYVIPADQHDPLTMEKMVNKLLGQGIDVKVSPNEFTHEGRVYGAGSYVVTLAQPKRGVIRWLLGQTYYPDNTFTRTADGDPIRPYDMSTDNMAEFMGVRVDPVTEAPPEGLPRVQEWIQVTGSVRVGTQGYSLNGSLNDSFEAMNLLFEADVPMRRVHTAHGDLAPGDFVIGADADPAVVESVARETGVDFRPLASDPTTVSHPLNQMRVGMYQRYWGGNMDEGWTRWLLEDFQFPYTSLMDARILEGDLRDDFDVILLPDDSPMMMKGPSGEAGRFNVEDVPPEYRSGFGDAGVAALEQFVQQGGTLVTFARAGDLAIEEFDLPIRNAVAGMDGNEFWSPGSTLRMTVDADHDVGYGMPHRALAIFLRGNQAYETRAGARSSDVEAVAQYVDRNVLESGWLLGEEAIANRIAIANVKHGQGRVVLIGFRTQHRAQTHGTFKFLFNTLVTAPPSGGAMAADGGSR